MHLEVVPLLDWPHTTGLSGRPSEVTANPFRLKMVGFKVSFHGRLLVPGDTFRDGLPGREPISLIWHSGRIDLELCRLAWQSGVGWTLNNSP